MLIVLSTKVTTIANLDQVCLPSYTFLFKLSSHNYIIWKSQNFHAIMGGSLKDIVPGNIMVPLQVISKPVTSSNEATTMIPNLNYDFWRRINKVILGWI